MKQFAVVFLLAITFSSCLKQSIADAMLQKEEQRLGGSAISMSYQVNGVLVKTIVNDVTNQFGSYYRLSCKKTIYSSNNFDNYFYVLSCENGSGELTFLFYTDSLKTTNYVLTGWSGSHALLSYNNTNNWTRYASDSLSFNITNYSNRRISGTFSGRLTPEGANPNTFGTAGSIAITNGVFENIPVLY